MAGDGFVWGQQGFGNPYHTLPEEEQVRLQNDDSDDVAETQYLQSRIILML